MEQAGGGEINFHAHAQAQKAMWEQQHVAINKYGNPVY